MPQLLIVSQDAAQTLSTLAAAGANIELLREVASRTDAKVTASGGISKLDDLRNIKELAELGVDAAILGKSLYARAFTLEEALEVAR